MRKSFPKNAVEAVPGILSMPEEDYKFWFEENALPLLVWDRETRVFLAVNEAAVLQYGYSREEFLGLTFKDLRPSEDLASALKKTSQAPSEMLHAYGVWRHRKKDGRVFPVEVIACWVTWAGRPACMTAAQDVTERERLQNELLRVGEAERRRIGRDLHDGVGPALTGIRLACKALEEKLSRRGLPEAALVREMEKALDLASAQVRGLSRNLFPIELERQGLAAVLQGFSEEVAGISGVSCSFKARPPSLSLENGFSLHLYRIAQEAVANALKHGRPRRLGIRLARLGGRIALTVADDGSGFPRRPRDRKGLGLNLMSYRAEILGGVLRIRTRPGRGTAVRCVAPLPRKGGAP